MEAQISRRSLFGMSAGLVLTSRVRAASTGSPVTLVQGENRRANVTAALNELNRELLPKLKGKKVVVIKPNIVATNKQLAATHADALRGVLDWLAPHFKGQVVIAESSAGNTFEGYEEFKYTDVAKEYAKQRVSLVDLNEEALFETIQLLNADLHIQPARLGKRLLDPDAFVISTAIPKTHNTVIATMNIKNMALGAPLHFKKGETKRWNDKRIYHGGVRQTHYDIMLTAQRLSPNWGVAVIDGYEGMEGNGPTQGTPVPHRIAIASPDFVAADRIGVECMGIKPEVMGYLQYCEQVGVGKFDRAGIELRGLQVDAVKRNYRQHADIDRELEWMGPLTELPPKLG